MGDLFREFFWIIFPVMGMGIGAFAIWNEFSRQKKALEVLKVYAEKGTEPPESVLAVLNRASAPGGGSPGRSRNAWGQVAFCFVMSTGFAGVAIWCFFSGPPRSFGFVIGLIIASFWLAAVGVGALVTAMTTLHQNDR